MPIPDNYLMMAATKAMLSSELFPQANEYWEEMKLCKLYKKADMKETIRIQAGGKETEQFGGVVLGGAGGAKEPPAGRPTLATVEYLEGCFESLVGVAVTGK